MTIVIELKPEAEVRLRDKAAARGQDVAAYVQFLAEQDVASSDTEDDPFDAYPAYDADVVEAIRAGVARGQADFAEGRYETAAAFHARMKARHGLPD